MFLRFDHPDSARSAFGNSWRGDVGRRDRRQDGFTVMEASVAGAIITLFLASIFALNSNMIHLLRAASEAANASEQLQLRVEQVRLANWNQITNPNWFSSKFFIPTDALTNLPDMTESVTVTPFLSPSSTASGDPPPGSFTVKRQNGVTTITPPGYADSSKLAQQEMIRIDVYITWPSLYRTRSRSLTTLVSRWGISK